MISFEAHLSETNMYFDQIARQWDNEPGNILRNEALASEIIRFLEGESVQTALEYGCATGTLSIMLKDRFDKIFLGDSSPAMIEVLKEKLQRFNIEHLDPLCIDLEKNTPSLFVDVIYTSMTMHHVKDISQVINEFYKLLKDNGLLIIADLLEEDGSFHWHVPDFDGHQGFDLQWFKEQLEAASLNVVYDNIFYTIPKKDANGVIKHYPVFVVMARKAKTE